MKYLLTLFLVVVSFSFGYELFFNNVFIKGMIFSPSHQKQVPMKFVLSASLNIFLPFKILIMIITLAMIFMVLVAQIQISILWWLSFFVSIFNALFFVSYLYPKMKRIIYWDLKNPVEKWDELYKNFNSASKLLVIISFTNFIVVVITYLVEIASLF